MKIRADHTAEAVVGGVVGSLDAPEALLLGGVDDQVQLRVVGRTVPGRCRRGASSVPCCRARGPGTRDRRCCRRTGFGQWSAESVSYTPAEPHVVVEVDADVCSEHSR